MDKYLRGKIYKITSPLTDEIYIGSTTEKTLARRLACHRSDHRRWVAGTHNYVTSFKLIGLAEYSIVLLETFPCNSKDELHAREQYHIDLHQGTCVNRNKAFTGLTRQEYMVQHNAQYREANRDAISEQKAQYRAANRDAIAEQQAQYRAVNKDTLNANARVKHACGCGGKYARSTKARHCKSQKHQTWQRQVDERQELIDRLTAKFGEDDWTDVPIELMLECLED